MKWHSEITTPKDGTHVLVASRSSTVGEAFFEDHDKRWYWSGYHWTDAADGSIDDVTSWMPLPQAPRLHRN